MDQNDSEGLLKLKAAGSHSRVSDSTDTECLRACNFNMLPFNAWFRMLGLGSNFEN